jgi:hypothetical protein
VFFSEDILRFLYELSSSQKFGSFLAYVKKIRPPIFLAAHIFLGPLLSSAAKISAPWQHWAVLMEEVELEVVSSRKALAAAS